MEAQNAIAKLSQTLLPLCDSEFLGKSRVHKLALFSTPGQQVYVKREDETGFLVSGTKRRKYASLLPWLRNQNIKHVALIGGEHSNHLPAFVQLCRENNIACTLFVKKAHQQAYRGNRFLLHLLAYEDEFVRIAPNDWHRVEEIVAEVLGPEVFIVPEGASCVEALPGSASLMLDILRNESSLGKVFDHLFVDAGTGMSAIGLVLAHAYVGHPSQIHLVLMADSEAVFQERLTYYQNAWAQLMGSHLKIETYPMIYRPDTGKSFGSVNRSVLNGIQEIAKKEGLLLDPVYNAKLFAKTYQILQNPQIQGNICLVHSGGGTGLMGFAELFDKKNPTRK